MTTFERRWLAAIAGIGLIFSLFSGAGAAPRKARGSPDPQAPSAEGKPPAWDVNAPGGPSETIRIDTTESTWTSVDVSPDGKTLVFDALGDIWTVALEGGDARALTHGSAWDFQPRFRPDGAQIAFISDRAGGDNLWVMNSDGSKPRALSDEKDNLVHNPCYSPDGDYIVAKKDFTSARSIPAGEIWLFHAEGGGGLQLTERPAGPKDQKTMAEPAFSPDGRYVYYSQDTTPGATWQYNKDSNGQIFVVKRLDRLTGDIDVVAGGPGGAVRPVPSPDGKLLAFVKRAPSQHSALYLRELSSGKEWPVYAQLDRDLQETNGSHGNYPGFAWTPDGKALVFWSAGQIRRLDLATREAKTIPIRLRATLQVQPALRFPVEVAPDSFRVRMPRWAQLSPAGDQVVFQALGVLWTRELPSGPVRRLTSQSDTFEFYPSFSRDGQWIVYATWDDEKLGTLRVVPSRGGASRVVVAAPAPYLEPRFSPDGTRIVYRKIAGGYLLSPLGGAEPGVYLAALSGGEPKRILRSGSDAHFADSPERVYFSEEVDDTKLVLKSVNLDGLDARTHLKGDEATEFRVSPDGRWVAFTEKWDAYVAPFTPTGRTVEIGAESKSLPVRRVSKRAGLYLNWSADSSKLHWSHAATLYSRELKDAFGSLTGSPEKLPDPVETGIDLGFDVPADRPKAVLALVGGRVVSMRDAGRTQEVIEDAVVVVRDNRIAAVGPRSTVQIPEGALRIDVTGKTVVPGFVDVHAHGALSMEGLTPQQNWMQFSNLSFGVTTIHDPSNDTESVFSAAELQRAGKILGPRIFSTGTILYGAHHPAYSAKIDTIDDARFHVRRLKEAGAISVKSYQQPRRDQRQMVIAAAREMGMMVVPEGGAKFEHNLTEIVDGHTGIEHAIPLAAGYDDVLQLWSKTRVEYTPTFVVAYGGLAGELYWYDRTEVWKNPRLMRFAPRSVIAPASIRRAQAPDDQYNHFAVARFAKALRDQGVLVHIGAHGQREGLAAHWEMWMMVQGGFSPWEALRAGTIDGAHYVGLDRDLGSIEPGKLADLVVIDGNPLTDIRRSEFVAYTMLNGRLYDPATLAQVAPERVERRPFFFEREGGDTLPSATQEWLKELGERLGWTH